MKRETASAVDSRLAKALAHPLRVQLLAALNQGVASPNELAKKLDEPLTNVSYHVRMLHDLGCIELVDTEPRRGALEHFYRPILREHLLQGGNRDGSHGEGARSSWTPLHLDAQGHQAVAEVLSETVEKLLEIESEVKSRVTVADGNLTPTEVAILHFERG